MQTIIGIDPGLKGGIAIFTPNEKIVTIMPTVNHEEKELDLHFLGGILAQHAGNTKLAVLEKVHAMPKQGVSSMFKFGKVFGAIEAMLVAYQIPYVLPTPQAWQKKVLANIPKDATTKTRALKGVQQLYPTLSLLKNSRCRTPHDGIVDAVLLAEYGRMVSK